MKTALVLIAAAVAYGVWRWVGVMLEPLGLGEFLFVGRFCLIVVALTVAERAFQRLKA